MSDEKPTLEELDRLLKERELKLKEVEIAARQKEADRSKWLNPVVIGLFAAAFGLLGNILVTRANNENTQQIEHLHAQSTLILEAIKTNGDTKAACKNLTFFVNLGLLDDANKTIIGACPENTQGVPTLPATSSSNIQTEPKKGIIVIQDERGARLPNVRIEFGTAGSCVTTDNGQCELPLGAQGVAGRLLIHKDGYVDIDQLMNWGGDPIMFTLKKGPFGSLRN